MQTPAEMRPPRRVADAVRSVNANAAADGQALYAPLVTVTGRLRDRDGRFHDLDLRGVLVMRPPRSIFLRLDHALESGQMQLGSNDEDYWLAIRRGFETLWWGRHRNLGRPGVDPIPLDPPRVADALGLRRLPESSVLGPYGLRDEFHDKLMYGRPGDVQKVVTDRIYYVDRAPPYFVRGIDFYDDAGTDVEMQVTLSDYQGVAGVPGRQRARRIEILWPRRESWMKINIEGLKVPETVHPRTFIRPTELPDGVRTMRQVDEIYEASGFGADAEPAATDDLKSGDDLSQSSSSGGTQTGRSSFEATATPPPDAPSSDPLRSAPDREAP